MRPRIRDPNKHCLPLEKASYFREESLNFWKNNFSYTPGTFLTSPKRNIKSFLSFLERLREPRNFILSLYEIELAAAKHIDYLLCGEESGGRLSCLETNAEKPTSRAVGKWNFTARHYEMTDRDKNFWIILPDMETN